MLVFLLSLLVAAGGPVPPAVPVLSAQANATPWPASIPAGGARLFTLLDYFDAGQRLALDYVADLDDAAARRARLTSSIPSCVRVVVRSGDDKSVVFASGVLVRGGRQVVTAGHSLQSLAGRKPNVHVILSNGSQVEAKLVALSFDGLDAPDWAVLDLVDPRPMDLKAAALGTAVAGELAFILGYPDRVGVGVDGKVASSLATESLPLDPLLFVARVPSDPRAEFVPLAGAVPLSGASGAPVFDGEGRLTGVLVAVGSVAYPEGLQHVYRVSRVSEFEAALVH